MTKEADRCRIALQKSATGKTVSLVSSGDAGVYGMAGLALELSREDGLDIDIEIIPGISAVNSASAKLGAPIMLDYATVSLSDLLVPWEDVKVKLEAVASADFAVALYNPKSKKRQNQLVEATEIFRRHRAGSTPVGVCTSVGYDKEEKIILTDLDSFQNEDIGMMTTVIIGNSKTERIGDWMVAPRGYKGKRF